MDTSDPEITFDQDGVCIHCRRYADRVVNELPDSSKRERVCASLIEKIKADGKGKEYDCIIGVSGGVDSTTLLLTARKFGLRTLAVHFDNGWDSEIAVDNINKALKKLNVELYTYVVDWEEFKDLQLSFLKASVPNCEIPTDHAISAVLWNTANKFGVRHILNGSNLRTEGILPTSWTYTSYDLLHIEAVHRKFGNRALKTFPKLGFTKFAYYVLLSRIHVTNLLNYIDYHKETAIRKIQDELDWRNYGGKHYESVWTRFYQGYYLPAKFGYDKRRAHLSTLVASGQMTREEALQEMEKLTTMKSYLLRIINTS